MKSFGRKNAIQSFDQLFQIRNRSAAFMESAIVRSVLRNPYFLAEFLKQNPGF